MLTVEQAKAKILEGAEAVAEVEDMVPAVFLSLM